MDVIPGAHAQAFGEVAHVVLARRDDARDQERLHAATPQALFEPRDVLRRPADVQTRDDANNSHVRFWILDFGFWICD